MRAREGTPTPLPDPDWLLDERLFERVEPTATVDELSPEAHVMFVGLVDTDASPLLRHRWIPSAQVFVIVECPVDQEPAVPVVGSVDSLNPSRQLLRRVSHSRTAGVELAGVSEAVPASVHVGVRLIDDLRQWLALRTADVAQMAGLAESTYYYWQRTPESAPRPASLDRLIRVHSVISMLLADGDTLAARRWLDGGRPSRREQLLDGTAESLDAVEDEAFTHLERITEGLLHAAGPVGPVSERQYEDAAALLEERERDADDLPVVEVTPESEPDLEEP